MNPGVRLNVRWAIIWALILLGQWQPVRAGPSDLVEWLTTINGLPDQRVEALARDRYGYLWIGTRGGLVRHEGATLSVLRHDPGDPDSLPGNNILALSTTRDGSVWAAISGQGLVQIRGLRVERHLRPADDGGELPGRFIWSMVEQCDGSLWAMFANDGLVRIAPDGALSTFPPGSHGLPDGGFGLDLAVDAECRLWLARTDGLWRVREDDGVAFEHAFDSRETEFRLFFTLDISPQGTFWVGTSGGIVQLAMGPSGVALVDSWPSVSVSSLHIADGGHLWVGTRQGLELFDPVTGRGSFRVEGDGDAENRLDRMMISDLLYDDEGGLWIATLNGVARLPAGWRAFEVLQTGDAGLDLQRVTSLMLDEQGRLWMSDNQGRIQSLDPAAIREGPQTTVALPSNSLVHDLHAEAGQLWALTALGVFRLDHDTGEWTELMVRERENSPSLRLLVPAEDGRLWIGGDGPELMLLRATDGQVEQRWGGDAPEPAQLAGESVLDLQRGPDGTWWLLGDRGVAEQLPDGRFVERFRTEGEQLLAMTFAGEHLWLASDSSLHRLVRQGDGRLEAEARWTAGDGLPAGQVRALVVQDRFVWLLTSIGLFRFDPQANDFRSFRISNRLTRVGFSEGAVAELADGRIAAGTPDGLVIIDPERVRPAEVAPQVYITRARAGEHDWSLLPGVREPLVLDWTNNSVNFEFQALSYADPARVRYRTRLEGWEQDWQNFLGQSSRWYGNLAPGRYRFQVQAANADGVWNRAGDALELVIAPPPWRSPGALLAYALVLALLIAWSWRALRLRRARRESLRRARAQQQLAESQRDLLNRLNRSLEPDDLAGVLVTALAELCGARRACFGFLATEFPDTLHCWPQPGAVVGRAEFLAAVEVRAAPEIIRLGDGAPCAAVWLDAPGSTTGLPDNARLELFCQAAGQVLENARLLQQVRRLAEEAREANAAKSRFLATMSHEIRTPLHGLLGLLELLQRGAGNAEQLDMLGTMMVSGRQLQRILNDVLDLSRIEAGRLSVLPEPFDLMPLIEGVIDLHASTAEAKGLALRLLPSARLPVMAVGDGDRIAQVLGNLVNNAIKFTGRGAVQVEAALDADHRLLLAVSDTGPGIDKAQQQELFEPFAQLESSSTRAHSGTGLGLAICRELVETMDGVLDLHSIPGRGSRFSVRLPLPGLAPQAPLSTGLLAGWRIGAALGAADRRVLGRLARRWRLQVLRLDAQAGRGAGMPDGAALNAAIIAPGELTDDALQALLDAGVPCWSLGPFEHGHHPMLMQLRPPLIESRLLAMLLDQAFRGRGM
ncbi:MAG: ATP-binding protein [Wenzhouxiangellaceae bacterium]|nr:ATP-binding protein [Wenzhouxiangellaceae bacterium]